MQRHILVVDDEESIRYTFDIFLTDEGYTVYCAADYEEGVALLESKTIDLIFVDIVLPGRNGLDLLKKAKEMLPNVPVVMITGAPSVDNAADSLRIGAFDYLVKPIRQDQLLRSAHIAIEHKSVRDEKEKCRLNYEAIFRSVNDGIITVGENMEIVEVNDAAARICAFEKEAVVGKPLKRLTDRCGGNCIDALNETMKTGQPVELRFIECVSVQGKQQVVSVTAAPLQGPQYSFTGAVMVVRDETHLVNLERRLQVRQKIDNIVGRSQGIEKVRALIRDLADVQTTVLVTGESGTGKELVVEALHYCGDRRNGPLVKVNCAALSENLLESELFGHVAGAFTGALKDRVGRFQRANDGTLFLDEIGEISQRMQLRLLRVIENMEFERVGDATPIKVDVRLVAATNRDLGKRVAEGRFREDLFYRLKVVQIPLPPLRERREDIPLLVEHFRRSFSGKFGKEIKGISSDVYKMLLSYDWPGNVRELENLLEHAFVRCRQSVITVQDLPPEFTPGGDLCIPAADISPTEEVTALLKALKHARGNKSEAARLLGISRRTIYRKLENLGIDPEDPELYASGEE